MNELENSFSGPTYKIIHNKEEKLELSDETYKQLEKQIQLLAAQSPKSLVEYARESPVTKILRYRKAADLIKGLLPDGELKDAFEKIFMLYS